MAGDLTLDLQVGSPNGVFFPMILTPHFQMDFQANHVRLSLRTEFEDMGLPENGLSRKTRHVVSHHVPHRNCHWGV